ncbi:MAG: hypothetical protein ACD_75C00264G0001, partial [uncultured bacterium]
MCCVVKNNGNHPIVAGYDSVVQKNRAVCLKQAYGIIRCLCLDRAKDDLRGSDWLVA